MDVSERVAVAIGGGVIIGALLAIAMLAGLSFGESLRDEKRNRLDMKLEDSNQKQLKKMDDILQRLEGLGAKTPDTPE